MPQFSPMTRRSGAPLLICAMALASTLTACSKTPPPPPPPPEVGVIKVQAAPAIITAEYVAQTEAYNAAEIRPRVGGLLERQVAVEGSTVKKGDLLFVIDQQPYIVAIAQSKAALAQAQSAYEQAQQDFGRVQPLAAVNAVSQQELDAVTARTSAGRASVEAAQAALKTAQLNLDYTSVTAPIEGIVGRVQLRVGGVVTAYNTLLTTIYATDPMYVNFSISERRMLELRRLFGADINGHYTDPETFKIILADGSIYPLAGKLNLIDAAVDPKTGTLPVRLEVPNPEHALLTGQFARVVVVVDKIPDALLVPQRAVVELQSKTSLWVVDAQGNAQSRDVQMGQRLDHDWIVQSGLVAGETVVVDGIQKVHAGTPVNAQPLKPAAAKPAAAPVAGAKP